jgi:O-antigen/teichoic acid export membrane protein
MNKSVYQPQNLIRQTKFLAIGKFGAAFLTLVTQFILVNALVVEDYAAYTIFVAATSVIVLSSMLGMDRVTYRFIPPLYTEKKWREITVFITALILVRELLLLLMLFLLWLFSIYFDASFIQIKKSNLSLQYALFSIALVLTDSMAIFCNGLALQGRQSIISLLSISTRFLIIFIMAFVINNLTVDILTVVLIFTEALMGFLLGILLVRKVIDIKRENVEATKLQFGFRWHDVVSDGMSTQISYMLGMPFRGSFLRVLVGTIANPAITAAFGFFQTLADRAYQFLPMFLLRAILEPALANDYSKNRNIKNTKLVVSVLLRLNFCVLFLSIGLLLGCGEPLVSLLTNGKYGSYVFLAALIILQMAALTLGEALWIGLNPVGRIKAHNCIWRRCAFFSYLALGITILFGSIPALIAVASTPYFAAFIWMRYVSREPVLINLGITRISSLLIPALVCAATAKMTTYLFPSELESLAAAAVGAIAYILTLKKVGLFQAEEVKTVTNFSPKIGRILAMLGQVEI